MGCHLPPGGRLKTNLLSRTRQRPSGARRTTGRTDVPVLFPLSTGSRPPTEKGNCEQVCTQDFSLGVWGGVSFPREKKCPPDLHTLDVQSTNTTPKRCAQEYGPGWHSHPAYATNAPLAHLLHAVVSQAHFLDAAVSILSPPRPSLSTTKGGAPVGAPPLETTPGCLQEGGKTPWPHFVAATGFVCLGLPLGSSGP